MDQKSLSSRQQRLRKYFEKVSPGIYDTRTKGLESLESSDQEMTGLEGGLEKLASNEILSNSDHAGLEAIIHKKFRPAVYVINNSFEQPPDPWTHFGENESRQNIESAIPSIGRIELPPESGIPFGGTGFVVGPGLLMTNRHVAEIFARGIGTKALRFKSGMGAGINFRKEVIPSPEVKDLTVSKVEMIHPFWDMALLRVEGLPDDQWLTMSTRDTEDLIGNDIAVIGYPAQDPRNSIELQNEIFGGVYNVKRMQPGKLDPKRHILSFGNEVNAVTHDASTLGGNSGSAVIDVQTGQILALHFAGIYLDANFAVPSIELARDHRVVDSGVNFSGSVDAGNEWSQRWVLADSIIETSTMRAGDGQQSPAATSGNVGGGPPSGGAPFPPSLPPANGSGPATITIPITLTVSVGQPQSTVQADIHTDQQVTNAGALEGLSGDDSDTIMSNVYRRASSSLLRESIFSTSAALTTAAASALVYSNNQESMEQTCRSEFEFTTCSFLRKNNSECFVSASNDTILVSFRGTQGIRDWIANMNVAEQATDFGMVHGGFLQGFLDIQKKIEDAVDAVDTNGQQLVLTGHSLGGALATLAASEWRNRYDIRSIYTYGQPAVGDRAFRDSMAGVKDRFFRVVNDDDIVTRIPPGYKHVGTRFKLPPDSKLESVGTEIPILENTVPYEMISETAFFELQQRVDPNLESVGLEGFLPSFRDHKIANYLKKLLNLSSIA